MRFEVEFNVSNQRLTPKFGVVHNISDGGFERGYAAGYEQGSEDGKEIGYADGQKVGYNEGYGVGKQDGYNEGLAARTYETWTITLTDGSTVEKEVALL